MTIDAGTMRRLYRMLRYVRRVEEVIAQVYPSDKIKSPVHLSIGQEAISVAVCDVLQRSDVVSGSYRGHAAYLAKGGDLNGMIAELYGKAAGCAEGKGGSMHLVDMSHNILGASAVVGTTIPVALGYALALKREGAGRVAVCFFGDGATEEGVFYESLNFAALQKLPILFVCENNFYAIHEPQKKRWAVPELEPRVTAFGIPYRKETKQDIFRLRDMAADLVAASRKGDGPGFIEAHCYRWLEHVGPSEDFAAGYRSKDELKPWVETDPLARLREKLGDAACAPIDGEIEAQIDAAVKFAEASPVPTPEQLYANIFA